MPPERISISLRWRIQERANGACEYCKAPDNFASSNFHCDHIIPRKVGGKTTLDNLAWACAWCNSTKHTKTHARDPQTGQRVRLFNPRRQNWKRHYRWSEDFSIIFGRTRSGRATIEALNMNRSELVNLRGALWKSGEYSPDVD